MALIHVLLVAVALPAVLAVPAESTTVTPAKIKGNCTNEQKLAINNVFKDFIKCFEELIKKGDNRTCNSITDLETVFRNPFLIASKCKEVNETKVNESIDVVLGMVNVTLNYALPPAAFKCITNNKHELKNCVNSTLYNQERLANNLGNSTILVSEVFYVNFQEPTASENSKKLEKCIAVNVLDKSPDCSGLKIADFIHDLFSVPIQKYIPTPAPGGKAASDQIPGFILMIATTLLLL